MFFTKVLFVFFLMDFYDAMYTRQPMRNNPCPTPHFSHGRFRVKQKSKVIRFICFPGFSLVGSRYATCDHGRWDEPTPVCVKPGCRLTPVQNALMIPSYKDAWVVFFCLPGHEMVGSPTVYCDGISWNGTLPTCVVSKNSSKLSCDFEDSDLCGWNQDYSHDFDWIRYQGNTPSSFLWTGPKYDHTFGRNGSSTQGHYMYIESTSKLVNQSARLISPVYDAELARDGCFSFYYHMYGASMGGLRVYQKPDSQSLITMLRLSKEEKQKFLLFEKWGQQGDTWYGAVSKLTNFSEDFQIIIEGVRGSSYLSDIAIDDVAILQGDNCTKANNTAVTPTPPMFRDSCSGRCDLSGEIPSPETGMCACAINCFNQGRCCPDFLEMCLFGQTEGAETTPDEMPQTQKLVASTTVPTTLVTKTTRLTSTPTTITTKATTKVNPTTSTTIRTIPKITSTTKRITTRELPTLVFESTTPIYNATGIIYIKKDKTEIKPTKVTTTKATTTTVTTPVKTTKLTVKSTVKPVRTVTKGIDADDKAKLAKERRIEGETSRVEQKEKTTSSGVNIAIALIVGIALCVCAAFLVHTARGPRGREIIARMRGRMQSDPEVRYLSAHMDE